jgi:branched-chain amino acid transport system ATP-binding protein
MIEQNARQGLQYSDRGYVLELGINTYQGDAQALLNDPRVKRAFLGGR